MMQLVALVFVRRSAAIVWREKTHRDIAAVIFPRNRLFPLGVLRHIKDRADSIPHRLHGLRRNAGAGDRQKADVLSRRQNGGNGLLPLRMVPLAQRCDVDGGDHLH